jgi:hypothetical protein
VHVERNQGWEDTPVTIGATSCQVSTGPIEDFLFESEALRGKITEDILFTIPELKPRSLVATQDGLEGEFKKNSAPAVKRKLLTTAASGASLPWPL